MGITCSCDSPVRYKDAVFSRTEPCLASIKTKTRWRKARRQNEQDSLKTKPRQEDFRKTVKNSVEIDRIEKEDEPGISKIKEIKVLPPIRKKTHSTPQISYKPNRVWGGSVSSYLGRLSCAQRLSGGARIAQWWQRSPPTSVSVWVEFTVGSPIFFPPQNPAWNSRMKTNRVSFFLQILLFYLF